MEHELNLDTMTVQQKRFTQQKDLRNMKLVFTFCEVFCYNQHIQTE